MAATEGLSSFAETARAARMRTILIFLTLAAPTAFLFQRTLQSFNDDNCFDGPVFFLLANVFYLATYALCLWVVAESVWRRHWPSCLLAVVAVALTWSDYGAIYHGGGDAVHVWLKEAEYRRVIDAHPGEEVFRFPWGGYPCFVTDGLMEKTLVYDRADRMQADVGKWANGAQGEGLSTYTQHIIGHFYLQTVN